MVNESVDESELDIVETANVDMRSKYNAQVNL